MSSIFNEGGITFYLETRSQLRSEKKEPDLLDTGISLKMKSSAMFTKQGCGSVERDCTETTLSN